MTHRHYLFGVMNNRKDTMEGDSITKILLATIIFLLICATGECDAISLQALSSIESDGDTNAISCAGAKHGRGIYQVSEIALLEYNNYNHTHIKKEQLFDPIINEMIALWFLEKRIPQLLKHFGHEVNVANIIQVYNLGIGSFNKGIRNKNYVKKYNERKT